eukprot:1828570-Heterocapsa_arctica.AAC.1
MSISSGVVYRETIYKSMRRVININTVRILSLSRGSYASRSRRPFAASAAVAGEESAIGAERPR